MLLFPRFCPRSGTLGLMPGMPDFPVDLGPEAVQSDPDTEVDKGNDLFDTQRGFSPQRNTPRQQPLPTPDGFGRYL